MDLLLVRHADAEPTRTTDFERRLTKKGRKQSEALGAYLKHIGAIPDRILASPLARAVETAELLQQQLQARAGVETEEDLASGMRPGEGLALIGRQEDGASLLLVGHEPDFSTLAATLCGMTDSCNFAFKKAAAAFFHVQRAAPAGAVLTGFVPPTLLP